MAKAIKFNLIIDKQPVRDLDDLRENFNVEDVLGAFYNGSLRRWLEVRELTAEREKLQKVAGEAPAVAAELYKIFKSECSEDDLATAAYIFELRQNEENKLAQYKSLVKERDEIISTYHAEYDTLLADMESKHNDYPFLKAAVQKIYERYRGLFILNAADFYDRFVFDFPLAIFSVLANANMRPLLTKVHDESQMFDHLTERDCVVESFKERFEQGQSIPMCKSCQNNEELTSLKESRKRVFVLRFSTDSKSSSSGKPTMSVFDTEELKAPFQYIDRDLSYPSHIKSFSGATDGHFTHLEPQGRQFMIIKMEEGNVVTKRDGSKDDELKAADVNGKFVILDGVDYSGKNNTDKLVYMEV